MPHDPLTPTNVEIGNMCLAVAMMATEMEKAQEAHGAFKEVLERPAVSLSVEYARKYLKEMLGKIEKPVTEEETP